jgi:hypothetical protein
MDPPPPPTPPPLHTLFLEEKSGREGEMGTGRSCQLQAFTLISRGQTAQVSGLCWMGWTQALNNNSLTGFNLKICDGKMA